MRWEATRSSCFPSFSTCGDLRQIPICQSWFRREHVIADILANHVDSLSKILGWNSIQMSSVLQYVEGLLRNLLRSEAAISGGTTFIITPVPSSKPARVVSFGIMCTCQ